MLAVRAVRGRMPLRIAGAAAAGVLLALGISHAQAGPDLMEGWYVYDYQAGTDVEPAVNVHRPAVRAGGAVWANHRQWSIDDPETPDSVLALIRYERWGQDAYGAQSLATSGRDLRGGCVRFELNTDALELEGGRLTFWVMSSFRGQRWHTGIDPRGGGWQQVTVRPENAVWHNSWRYHPSDRPSLDHVLEQANSYGIGIVGFDGEPTGRLGMCDFGFDC